MNRTLLSYPLGGAVALLIAAGCAAPLPGDGGAGEEAPAAAEAPSFSPGSATERPDTGRGHEERHVPVPGENRPLGGRGPEADTWNFTYDGGSVISNVEVQAVYWGYYVNSTVQAEIPEFYATVTNSPYMDWLSEYDTPTQTIGRGSLRGTTAIAPSNHNTTLQYTDIQNELAAQIDAAHVPAPDANTLYMIHLPQGITAYDPNGHASCGNPGWCAFHYSFTHNGQSIRYGVVADMAPGSACDGLCGTAPNFFNNVTAAAAHEMMEAVTDPDPIVGKLSWYSTTGGEIGDVCNHELIELPGTPYIVQKEWSKQANACVVVGPQSGVMYTVGDFDGDGKSDVIVTDASGSEWWFSNGDGTWAKPYAKRTDLTLGSVAFTIGDFDGDGRSDMIVSTITGSKWYFSQWTNSGGTRSGSWDQSYTRSDLPIGVATYTIGDFNGDGKSDMIIVTPSGSYWYFSTSSNGVGSWNANVYVRTDLPLQSVAYTAADMDGDGKTDLIITDASGSYWYFSNGDGTWKTPYSNTGLWLGGVSFTPGDYSGSGTHDSRADLIVTTTAGSYWWWSSFINGAGSYSTVYTRTDLKLGQQNYTPGNFGDSNLPTDFLITRASGSYLYWSNGSGGFTQPWSNTNLTYGNVLYTVGDFNGDGIADVIMLDRNGTYFDLGTGGGTWTNMQFDSTHKL
jgi:hypothetical protein